MRIRRFIFPAALLTLASGGGCSHYRALRADIDSIRNDVDTLKTEVRQINDGMARQYELLRMLRADQQMNFNELDRNLNTISGALAESQQRLTRIDEKTQAIKQGWDEKNRNDSLSAMARTAEIAGLFDIALHDFESGMYAIALTGFADVARRFPDAPQAADAAYWSGECYLAQDAAPDAETAFSDYLKRYPQGKYVCASLFKLGLIYGRDGRPELRTAVWTRLRELCPASEEAQIAAERMDGQ